MKKSAFILRHKIATHPNMLWRTQSQVYIMLKCVLCSGISGFRCQASYNDKSQGKDQGVEKRSVISEVGITAVDCI
jgi:hypothetical protein